MISYAIRLVVLIVALFLTMPVMAQNGGPVPPTNTPKEQGSQSGLPLSYYCNSVPDLSIERSDAVDNWVKICNVYFKAHTNRSERPRRAKGRQSHPPHK